MSTTHTTIRFADGRTFDPPPSWPADRAQRVAGLDAEGFPVGVSDGTTYGMTDCCGATFTGSIGGIACRACYDLAYGNDLPMEPVSPRVEVGYPYAEAGVDAAGVATARCPLCGHEAVGIDGKGATAAYAEHFAAEHRLPVAEVPA